MENKEEKQPEKKLTVKELLFVSEYLKDFNATRAAIEAGYSKTSARQIGCENLTKPSIRSEINKEIDYILKNNKDIALKVVRESEKIAFSKLTDYMEYDDDGITLKPSGEIDSSAIESIQIDSSTSTTENGTNTTVKKRIKLYDKNKSLELLAKYSELYKETSVNINLPINIIIEGVEPEPDTDQN